MLQKDQSKDKVKVQLIMQSDQVQRQVKNYHQILDIMRIFNAWCNSYNCKIFINLRLFMCYFGFYPLFFLFLPFFCYKCLFNIRFIIFQSIQLMSVKDFDPFSQPTRSKQLPHLRRQKHAFKQNQEIKIEQNQPEVEVVLSKEKLIKKARKQLKKKIKSNNLINFTQKVKHMLNIAKSDSSLHVIKNYSCSPPLMLPEQGQVLKVRQEHSQQMLQQINMSQNERATQIIPFQSQLKLFQEQVLNLIKTESDILIFSNLLTELFVDMQNQSPLWAAINQLRGSESKNRKYSIINTLTYQIYSMFIQSGGQISPKQIIQKLTINAHENAYDELSMKKRFYDIMNILASLNVIQKKVFNSKTGKPFKMKQRTYRLTEKGKKKDFVELSLKNLIKILEAKKKHKMKQVKQLKQFQNSLWKAKVLSQQRQNQPLDKNKFIKQQICAFEVKVSNISDIEINWKEQKGYFKIRHNSLKIRKMMQRGDILQKIYRRRRGYKRRNIKKQSGLKRKIIAKEVKQLINKND